MLTYFLNTLTYANSIHKNALLSDDLASDVKRLSISYDKQNAAWTKYSDMFGFYIKEKSFDNGKPSYISEHKGGAYTSHSGYFQRRRKIPSKRTVDYYSQILCRFQKSK